MGGHTPAPLEADSAELRDAGHIASTPGSVVAAVAGVGTGSSAATPGSEGAAVAGEPAPAGHLAATAGSVAVAVAEGGCRLHFPTEEGTAEGDSAEVGAAERRAPPVGGRGGVLRRLEMFAMGLTLRPAKENRPPSHLLEVYLEQNSSPFEFWRPCRTYSRILQGAFFYQW